MDKTKYMVVGGQSRDIHTDKGIIKACTEYKYLGVTITNEGVREKDILNKVAQGTRTIQLLNPILWSKKITKTTKKMLYKTIVQNISTYGSEIWTINKKCERRLKSLEMNYWRRSCGISRLDRIRNEDIKERMDVQESIIDVIEQKQLLWYGHLRRMPDTRWPQRIYEWVPWQKRKQGRPCIRWKDKVANIL